MKTILTIPNSILTQTSLPVTDFGTETQQLIDEMIMILSKTTFGVGLAAPQIGVLKRIFLISNTVNQKTLVVPYINPQINFYSKEKIEDMEGCLSVPLKVGLVERSIRIRACAQNRQGKIVKIKVGGFLAREIQHELDHLNGILFIDRTTTDKLFDFHVENGKWIVHQKEGLTPKI